MLVTYTHASTHTEEYLTNYVRIFVMSCNVSFLCTCLDINLFLFVLLCFEGSLVRVIYIVCFSILSHHKLWEQHYSTNNPTVSLTTPQPHSFTYKRMIHVFNVPKFSDK